ncbi:MAG TPA: DUF4340 domain-containing protein [Polyangiaceae bacterium]|nr:DUF4340 domain-containing protein [Polyangiaceae bacterium]
MKGLWPHVAALVVAAVLALTIWSRDDKAIRAEESQQVEIWGGSPDQVESVRFESPKRTVTLSAQKDAVGRYYVTEVDKEEIPRPPPHGAPDAGAPASEPPKRTDTRFIGVKDANEIVAKLAPLLAIRQLGPLGAGRAEEFGFDKPEGTLKVKIGGAEQALVIGSATPGGQERYAKLERTGVVYAMPGDVVQSMLGAESRLLERDWHAFQDADVSKLRITRAGKTREVVPMAAKKGAWADAATPSKLDESIGNWLTKVSRLHVMEYVENPPSPLKPEDALVRLDYFAGSKPLGFLELYKLPGEKGNDYYVRSENSRWFVKVLASAGDQVAEDAPSIVK